MPDTPRAVVLDTNVVLDWLLFRDAGCASLSGPLQQGQLRWHATPSMRSELANVLQRHELQRWAPDCEHILSRFDSLAKLCPEAPNAALGAFRLCSRDPDDQKFIDLAVHVKASWLLSRDRALLQLARPARKLGLQILTPAGWRHAATP